jgi:hypothetical protein
MTVFSHGAANGHRPFSLRLSPFFRNFNTRIKRQNITAKNAKRRQEGYPKIPLRYFAPFVVRFSSVRLSDLLH